MAAKSEFIRRLRERHPEAYEILVRRFETPLYRYFLASHGDPQLACEQSADCFGDLVECLPKMRGGEEQLRPFVFSVAKNVLRRRWRRERRECTALHPKDEPADNWPAPYVALEAAEATVRLIDAIRRLDEPTRDVFLLRFVEQLSVADVAAALGEPVGTVKSRLSRGRQQLSAILKIHERTP